MDIGAHSAAVVISDWRRGRSVTLAEINRMIRGVIRAARKEGIPEVQVTIGGEASVRIPLAPEMPHDKELARGKEVIL